MSTALDLDLEAHRVALTGYCYRMLGSAGDAEDAVQETMIRAWRNIDRFEGRSSVKTWLHSIATNVCFDQLKGSQRRARPMDMGPSARQPTEPGDTFPETTWLSPVPDGAVVPDDGDPAEVAIARDTIRLAFVAALQHLPPKQRAVLILREVLRWRAEEVATLLDTTVQSVNSALQRARATLADRGLSAGDQVARVDDGNEALLARYVEAFERYDIDALVSLLHEDATLSMPPYALWIVGPTEIAAWHLGPGHGCRGSRLVPTWANGSPAFGQYRDGGRTPWALQVLEIVDGRIVGLNAFLDTDRLFPLFGLPQSL